MNRYLSFLRKKMHGGQVDVEREPARCETKRKRIHRVKPNNVAPCDFSTDNGTSSLSQSISSVDFNSFVEISENCDDPQSAHSDNDSLLDNQSFDEPDRDSYKGYEDIEKDDVHNTSNDDFIDHGGTEFMRDDNNFDSGFPCSTSPLSDEVDTTDTNESDDRSHDCNLPSDLSSLPSVKNRQVCDSILPKCYGSHDNFSINPNVEYIMPYKRSICTSDIVLPGRTESASRRKSCPDKLIICDNVESRSSQSSEDDFRSALDYLPNDSSQSNSQNGVTETAIIQASSVSEASCEKSLVQFHDTEQPPSLVSEELRECEKMALIETAMSAPTACLIELSDQSTFKPLGDGKLTNSSNSQFDPGSPKSVILKTVGADHARAEARLAQKRAARAEAREMRLKELEKTQQEENNEEEQQYAANSFTPVDQRSRKSSLRSQNSNSKTATRSSARSSVNRSSLVNSNSYSRSSDGSSDEALPSSAREIKSELKEVEEKFRKAMISNAQLDNEKSTLTYEVEFIKDKFTELEELHVQLNKEHRKKCSENEQLRKLSNKLQEEVKMVRTVIQERDELIQEYGLVVIGEEESREEYPPNVEEEMNDDTINNLSPRKIAVKKALLSQEAAELLSKGATSGSLDVRLKKYAEEKHELEDEVRRLRMELEEELHRRHKENGLDNEKQKEASKSLNDYKLRVQKSEAEVSTLQATVARLESLVTRYKSTSEELEKSEEELKVEKRKLMRELRDAQNRLEELEVTSSHLQKRFEKLKNARSNLLKDISQDPA